eukprot:scaffold655_cov379-Prasinococcus_capsulatus_cf.AAC.5
MSVASEAQPVFGVGPRTSSQTCPVAVWYAAALPMAPPEASQGGWRAEAALPVNPRPAIHSFAVAVVGLGRASWSPRASSPPLLGTGTEPPTGQTTTLDSRRRMGAARPSPVAVAAMGLGLVNSARPHGDRPRGAWRRHPVALGSQPWPGRASPCHETPRDGGGPRPRLLPDYMYGAHRD